MPLLVLGSQALCSQVAFPSKRVEGTGNDCWKTQAARTKITLPLKEREWETNSYFKNKIYSKSFFSVLKFLFYRQTNLLTMRPKCWICSSVNQEQGHATRSNIQSWFSGAHLILDLISTHLQKYMKFMQKIHLFSCLHLQALLFQQNIISKSASCICRKHNSSSYLARKKIRIKLAS